MLKVVLTFCDEKKKLPVISVVHANDGLAYSVNVAYP